MANLSPVQSLFRRKVLYSSVGVALVIGIILVVNFIVSYIPLRIDLSRDHAYSLSRGTKLVLGKLDDTLLVRVMFSQGLPPEFRVVERFINDLIIEYKRAGHGKVKIERVDPAQDDNLRRAAMQAGVSPVHVDVIKRGRREVSEAFMGLTLQYGDKLEAVPFIRDTRGAEYEITSRIKKLIDPTVKKIGIIQNGGAMTFESEPLLPLGQVVKQQYSIVNVDLSSAMPEGVDTLWLLGPTQRLDQPFVDQLRAWVKDGHTLGLLLDKYTVDITQFRPTPVSAGLESLLEEWGIDEKQALIGDMQADRIQIQTSQGNFRMINVIDYPFFPFVSDVSQENPATKLIGSFSMPFVSPLEVKKPVQGITYTPLAKTSQMSWLDETAFDLSPLRQYAMPDGGTKGPFTVALLAEGDFNKEDPAQNKTGRVLLFGCSRFIRTDFPPRQTNFQLFLNFLDWTSQDEILIGIRSKGISVFPLRPMSEAVKLVLKYALAILLPFLTLIVGLVMWSRHKNRMALMPLLYQGD